MLHSNLTDNPLKALMVELLQHSWVDDHHNSATLKRLYNSSEHYSVTVDRRHILFIISNDELEPNISMRTHLHSKLYMELPSHTRTNHGEGNSW